MQILELHLDRYRNIRKADLECNARFNLIVGENGQGKTNLLSAVYWLSTLTPLRTRRVREMVQWGEQEMGVNGMIELKGLKYQLSVRYQNGKRLSLREDKVCSSKDYFGVLSIISFTPNELNLVYGPPEMRRRFLDRAIFTEHTSHLDTVLRCHQALNRRNKFLRQGGGDQLLSAYEATLAEVGARLMASRARYIHDLSVLFSQTFHDICGFNGSISYKPGLPISDPLETRPEMIQAQLIQYWERHRESDRQRGFTQRGPHMDDLSLRLDDRSAKSYASQGQQRAIVLALKIAQIEALSERMSARPVLLLDDVSSELDHKRAALLFSFLNHFDGQVFLTSTHEQHIPLDGDVKIWRVEAGNITGDSI